MVPCPVAYDDLSCDRLAGAHVCLAPGEVWARSAPHGLTIRVARGVAWVTQSGDRDDHVLHDGGQFEARGGAKVVVQAIEACAFAWE